MSRSESAVDDSPGAPVAGHASGSPKQETKKLGTPQPSKNRTRDLSVEAERKQPSPSEIQGGFRFKRFQDLKLGEIADRIQKRLQLSVADAQTLSQAPFAALAALAEGANRIEQARLKPLFYVPIGSILQQSGSSKKALQTLADRTDAVLSHCGGENLSLAIDEWGDSNSFPKILETLVAFCEIKPEALEILGPSTADLRKLAPAENDETGSHFTPDFFSSLKSAGVDTIEGGSNRALHSLAAKNGFRLAVAQNLVRTRLAVQSSTASNEGFLQELYAVREELVPSRKLETWFPWSSAVLDTGLPKADTPLGFEFLRALLLGRLLLPEVPYIRASVSLVGIRLAELAYSFGANDFGYVSADAETAERLGLIPMSSAVSEFQVPHSLSASGARTFSTSVTNL